jgi:hypothetical protein
LLKKGFTAIAPGLQLMPVAIPWMHAGVHLLANLIIIMITIQILKTHKIKGVYEVAKPRPIAVAPEPPASVIS